MHFEKEISYFVEDPEGLSEHHPTVSHTSVSLETVETPPSVKHYSLGSHAVNISADKAAVSADGIATLAIRDVSVAKPSSTALPPCDGAAV